jgi:hypothetical protein
MTRASNILSSIPHWRQQCDSVCFGNKPEEVQILSRHPLFEDSIGGRNGGGHRGDHRLRIMSMASVIHSIAQRGALASICAVLFLVGCASAPMPAGSRLIVSASAAQFYKNGPAQDIPNLDVAQHTFDNYLLEQHTGPDFELPKGAIVTMLKREPGYSKVVTDGGVSGYVANDQLKPAPPMASVPAPSGMPSVRSLRRPTRARPPIRQREEQLNLQDVPLPPLPS